MRPDMAKVIVERPRYGSRLPSRKKGYRKFEQSIPSEELPAHEPMLGRWQGRQRFLNEHLGPMRRFLRSNIGRPWNKVHQDLCEFVSFDNAVQAHVLSHVFQYVQRHVEIRDRRVFAMNHFGRRHELRAGEMYVCPSSGLLKAVRPDKRRRPPVRVNNGPFSTFLFRDNTWWDVKLRKFPDEPSLLWDVWLERNVIELTQADCVREYGGKLIAVSKRPLSRQEQKDLYRRLRRQRRS